MEKIYDLMKISFLIIFVFFCINPIVSDVTGESLSSSLSVQASSVESHSEDITENATTHSTSTVQPEEHIAVRKWKNSEKILKNILTDLYKTVLPFMVRSNEDLDISPQCSRGLMKMLVALKQMKLWSFQSK